MAAKKEKGGRFPRRPCPVVSVNRLPGEPGTDRKHRRRRLVTKGVVRLPRQEVKAVLLTLVIDIRGEQRQTWCQRVRRTGRHTLFDALTTGKSTGRQ